MGTAHSNSRPVDSEVRRQSPRDEAARGRPTSSLDRLELSPRPRPREDFDKIPSSRSARNEQRPEPQSRSTQPVTSVTSSEDATRSPFSPAPNSNTHIS